MIVTIVCLPGAAGAEAVKLGGDEIREAVTGSLLELDTPLGTTIPIRFTGDGLMTGKAGQLSSVLGAAKDRGRWWVKGDRLCYKWFRWFEAQSQCMTVQMKDERVYWHQDDGKRGTATIVERAVVVAEEPKKSVQDAGRTLESPCAGHGLGPSSCHRDSPLRGLRTLDCRNRTPRVEIPAPPRRAPEIACGGIGHGLGGYARPGALFRWARIVPGAAIASSAGQSG